MPHPKAFKKTSLVHDVTAFSQIKDIPRFSLSLPRPVTRIRIPPSIMISPWLPGASWERASCFNVAERSELERMMSVTDVPGRYPRDRAERQNRQADRSLSAAEEGNADYLPWNHFSCAREEERALEIGATIQA